MASTSPDSQQLREAKQTVYRSLKYRPRSEYELRKKLCEKNFSGDIAEQTIGYFKQIGLVDDQQFSLGWTRSKLNKPVGLRRIRQELKTKGIDEDVINTAIEKSTDLYDEPEAVRKLIEKRKNKYHGLDKQTVRRRMFGYLARRGFQTQTIIKEIHQLIQ